MVTPNDTVTDKRLENYIDSKLVSGETSIMESDIKSNCDDSSLINSTINAYKKNGWKVEYSGNGAYMYELYVYKFNPSKQQLNG